MNNLINQYFLYFILFFSVYSLDNSVIEIPIIPIEANRIPKYPNITIKERDENIDNKTNNIILIEEGQTTINPNSLFLANIKIGSSQQQFNLILDTGSVILWVPKVGSKDKHQMSNHFNPSNSANTTIPFYQKYGTGSCYGYYFKDNINYIFNKNFQMKFGVANITDFYVSGGDGIIGLAHYYNDKSLSFIHSLYEAGITNSKKFSFKFGEDISSGQKGKIIIGKHDDFSSSEVVSCPLINFKSNADIFWACQVTSFGLKNNNYEIKAAINKNLIFDTGTNAIILPLETLYQLKDGFSKFGCDVYLQSDQKTNQIRCKNNENVPNFRFEINGNILTLPRNYGFYKSSSYYIFSTVLFQQMSNYYIIGSPFFLAFHTLFDEETGKLFFHPESRAFIERGSWFTASNIGAIVVVIILIIGLAVVIYYFIKYRKAKRDLDAFPQNNYNYSFL